MQRIVQKMVRPAVVVCLLTAAAAAGAALAADERVPYSKESVARGRFVYLQNCQDCHGDDGKAQGSAIAVAADLTSPERWKFGQTDNEIFTNIKNGAGDNMPPFGPIGPGLKDAQIWDLVNYIRSIGPENRRPKP
jgi:mono/diheme cytochrome c family protein